MNTPYFPIPFSPGVLSGAADETFPQLIPRLTLADGPVLQPLSYFKDVEVSEDGARTTVAFHQDEWDRMGETAPVTDDRASVRTRYVLEPGAVTRSDEIAFDGSAVIDLEFPTFSRGATQDGAVIRFAQGEVASFEATGMTCAPTTDFDPAVYAGATGAFRTLIRCRAEATDRASLSWTIRFSE